MILDKAEFETENKNNDETYEIDKKIIPNFQHHLITFHFLMIYCQNKKGMISFRFNKQFNNIKQTIIKTNERV